MRDPGWDKPAEDRERTALMKAIREQLDASGVPLSVFATRLGKDVGHVSRQLNPYDEGGKLGAVDLPALCRVIGSDGPLRVLAGVLGRVVVAPGGCDPEDPRGCARLALAAAGAFGEAARRMAEASADGVIDSREAARIVDAAESAAGAIMALAESLRPVAESPRGRAEV